MENSINENQVISMKDPNGTFFTTKHGDVVSVDYDRIIAVGNGDYITQAELDETGSIISYTFMRDGVLLLDLDANEYLKFINNNTLIAGERLRLIVKKTRKEKETK